MENLRLLNFNLALDLLKQAENLLNTANIPDDISKGDQIRLLALTYNNIGCFFKKLVKYILTISIGDVNQMWP